MSDALTAHCSDLRQRLGAAAVSVSRVAPEGDRLVFVAADGAGADAIVGVELPVTRGIAGYVAATGQAMILDRVASNPRFARDVAERTGYVPRSLLVTPIVGRSGTVLGVLSVLDRDDALELDPLAIASATAAAVANELDPPASSDGSVAVDDAVVAALIAELTTLSPATRRRVLDAAARILTDDDVEPPPPSFARRSR